MRIYLSRKKKILVFGKDGSDVGRRPRLHIDHLCLTPLEEYCLRVVELTVIDSYIMVLAAD